MNDFHPDIDHARQFLALLDSDPASFTFQVIPERGGCKTKPMISHGSIDDLADRLFEANKAGAGVFFMVNAGDKKGRCAENVQRVRAHFVDLDTPGVDPLGVDTETISRFERGATLPSLLTLEKISKSLKVGIGELLAESSAQPDDLAFTLSAWLSTSLARRVFGYVRSGTYYPGLLPIRH